MLWIDDVAGRYRATLSGSESNFLDSGQTPVAGTWQHIAATYDGATARFFVNGTQVASKAFSGNVGDNDTWRIGAYDNTPFGFFDGLIDEVRIYDRAVNGAQIQSDMNTPVTTSPAVIATTPDAAATGQTAAPAITREVQHGDVRGVDHHVDVPGQDRLHRRAGHRRLRRRQPDRLARRDERAGLRHDLHGDRQGRGVGRQERRRRGAGRPIARGRSRSHPSRRSS